MFIPHLPLQTVQSERSRERYMGQCVLARPLREPHLLAMRPAQAELCFGQVCFLFPTCSPGLPCGF